jgi:hypothetical protein
MHPGLDHIFVNWAMPLPCLLHCLVTMFALAWELLFTLALQEVRIYIYLPTLSKNQHVKCHQ